MKTFPQTGLGLRRRKGEGASESVWHYNANKQLDQGKETDGKEEKKRK